MISDPTRSSGATADLNIHRQEDVDFVPKPLTRSVRTGSFRVAIGLARIKARPAVSVVGEADDSCMSRILSLSKDCY